MADFLQMASKALSMSSCARIFTLLLLLIATSSNAQQITQAEREKGWSDDLDFFIQQIKLQHYYYHTHDLPADFNSKAQTLRKKIPFISDEQLLFEFEGLAATLGDGHTFVRPWGADHVITHGLPFSLYQFSDGLFIVDARAGFEEYIGNRIDMLGALKEDQATSRIADYVSHDNEVGASWHGPFFLTFQGALEEIGVEKDDDIQGIQMSMVDRSGKKVVKPMAFVKLDSLKGTPVLNPSRVATSPAPLYLKNQKKCFWITAIPAKGTPTLYVQFNQVLDDPKETLQGFSSRLSDTLKRMKPKHIIIDVRHNGFGNAKLLDPLLDVLSSYKASHAATKVTFVTGRNTFSACQLFISRAESLLHPIFAGERTSSKPNFVNEAKTIVLPFSGATCGISSKFEETFPGDKRQWIEIDIPVALSSKAYFLNEDPVMDKVLAGK